MSLESSGIMMSYLSDWKDVQALSSRLRILGGSLWMGSWTVTQLASGVEGL